MVAKLIATAGIIAAAAATAIPAASPAAVRVVLRPEVVQPGEATTLTVSGVAARSLEARLAGATTSRGRALPWVRLRRVGRFWKGLLPKPAWRGTYPIQLRAGARVRTSRSWLLLVVDPGTLARPSFATPEAVVRWWVQTARPRSRLVALKRWRRPSFDRRDPRLHQLVVVSYGPRGDKRAADRRGMFVTAFRDGYEQRWRLLAVSVYP